jgi:hypothetical protein
LPSVFVDVLNDGDAPVGLGFSAAFFLAEDGAPVQYVGLAPDDDVVLQPGDTTTFTGMFQQGTPVGDARFLRVLPRLAPVE